MMKHDDFAVFILTHGRADNVVTAKALKRQGYTGKWYIVIDNEDETEQEYRKRFPGRVLQFDKLAVSKTFDIMDTRDDRLAIVYARNACFQIAKDLGIRYFLELDDDYTSFQYRWIKDDKLKVSNVKHLDRLFDAMIDFLQASGANTVAFAQGGDFIGGKDSARFRSGIIRKAMNTFFCDSERPFTFVGRMNEDVSTYTWRGSQGWLGFSITAAMITQKPTQGTKGGMSAVYLDSGTYVKTFYSVMCMPSAIKISVMGDKHIRIHHKINWGNCVPKIISSEWKK